MTHLFGMSISSQRLFYRLLQNFSKALHRQRLTVGNWFRSFSYLAPKLSRTQNCLCIERFKRYFCISNEVISQIECCSQRKKSGLIT